jgi:hypothetical protein
MKPARAKSRWRHALEYCKACGKDFYNSYSQAQRMVLKALNERDTQLYIYHCPNSDEKYHVTKMEVHDDRGEVL